jgi:UDP-N-acetylmuramate--alanine ligase
LVIDDYGHHPTEIRATLSALRDALPKRRLVVLFQPHRYTRTRGLAREFHTAFHAADILVLTEIYGAGESPIADVSTAALLESIQQHGQRQAHLVPDVTDIARHVLPLLKAGDLVLTLGAGDIWQVGEELLELLQ